MRNENEWEEEDSEKSILNKGVDREKVPEKHAGRNTKRHESYGIVEE